MSYLDELKESAQLHARAQGIRGQTVRSILARIDSDEAGRPGSWTYEWVAAARRREARSRHLEAAALYGLARFPYVDSSPRAEAHDGLVRCFERWRDRRTDSVRRTVTTADGTFAYYATGVARGVTGPVLVVLGGIISPKEQWAPLMRMSGRLQMPVVVTEMPGVGENRTRYTPASAAQLSALLDDLRAEHGAYVLGMSFGGHLALRCAAVDPRIHGIATVGAPIDGFFRAPAWAERVPLVTQRVLAHLTGLSRAELPEAMTQFALDPDALGALSIPVHYIASRHDEVVPSSDVAAIAHHMRRATVVEFDDVHGSPHHLREMRASLALAMMDMRGIKGVRPRLLEAFLRLRGVTALGSAVS